jgi:hypothetical protein
MANVGGVWYGGHRIRHYGLFASANRAESIATARALLGVARPAADPQKPPDTPPDADAPRVLPCPCSRCGARMIVIEVFARGCEPRWRPTYGSVYGGSRSYANALRSRTGGVHEREGIHGRTRKTGSCA